jgi:hypothetical protein
MITRRLAWGLLLLLGAGANGQEAAPQRAFGDPTLAAALGARMEALYEAAGDWRYVLTRRNPLELPGAAGTEVRGAYIDNRPTRVLASTWMADGVYSVEYLVGPEGLLFVFETFEYFEEDAPEGAWRNARGLAAWERRSYWRNEEVGYSVTVGVDGPNPGADGERLRDRGMMLFTLLPPVIVENER